MSSVYNGWIPTVAGRLSYRSIGDSLFPTRSVSANIPFVNHNGRVRYILAYQRRNLSDAIQPAILNRLKGESGIFYFSMLARTVAGEESHNNKLTGAVFIYTHPTWSLGKPHLRYLIQTQSFKQDQDTFESAYLKHYDITERNADIAINFELCRNGFLTLQMPKINTVGILQNTDPGDFDIIANQAYFFLRDISHTHQHHNPTSDTLLTVQKSDSQDQDAWKRHVMYSLIFHIIQKKRKNLPEVQAQLEGIVSYAATFRRIAQVDEPEFNLKNLRRSILAKKGELSAERQAITTSRNTGLALCFSVIAAFLTATALIAIQVTLDNGRIDVAPAAKELAKLTLKNFQFVYGILILGLLYSFVLLNRGPIFRSNFFRDVARLVLILTPHQSFWALYYATGLLGLGLVAYFLV